MCIGDGNEYDIVKNVLICVYRICFASYHSIQLTPEYYSVCYYISPGNNTQVCMSDSIEINCFAPLFVGDVSLAKKNI